MKLLNIFSYNVDVAKIFGIKTSIFLTCIDNEYEYQKRNNLLKDEFIGISRTEIYERTAIDEESQKEIETKLQECKVIEIKPFRNIPNKNYYVLYKKVLYGIINSENIKIESSIKQCTKTTRNKLSKKQTHINNMKKCIKLEDQVLRQYMTEWVDAVYSNPKGFLSESAVKLAIEDLENFSDNQTIKIEIMKIAIKNGQRDLKWAIDQYMKNSNDRNFNNIDLNKKINKDMIGDDIF